MGNKKNNWFYIKNFKMNSLFWRTFLVISLLIVVPFLTLGILFYSNTFKSLKKEIMFENSSVLDGTKNIVDSTLSECDMLSSYIASNSNTQPFMLSSNYEGYITELAKLAKTLPLIYKYIDSVYIYSEYNSSVYAGERNMPMDEFTDTAWLEDYKVIDDIRGIIISRNKNNTYPPLITIIKPIYVADEKRGAVIMNINSQTLYRSLVYGRYKDGQEFFLLDSSGRIIMSKDISYFNQGFDVLGFNLDSQNGENSVSEENNVIVCSSGGQFGFTYISTYPMTLYEQQLSKIRWQVFIISLGLLIFCFIIAYVISATSYTPLREIISFLDTAAPVAAPGTNDQNELIYIINSIKLHIKDKEKMEEILKERMNMLKRAQYDMLQAQINPHFLYNTLETINWMAFKLSGSENPVSTSLVKLAAFFRNTLSSSGYLISVEEEIKYTKDYINILELRYGDLFDIEWNIDQSLLSCTIIKICFQPIIENAVYHGFKPKDGKGLLTISGTADKSNAVFTLRDDGVGMDAASLERLNTSLRDNVYSESGKHIGLENVNKRIKIIFGEKYGIFVKSKQGYGTEVIITIPITEQS
ncbi:MAG: histidine kinase [Clostridiales bacterium]|nr:histidine kinase [Clostridiales bacterium]